MPDNKPIRARVLSTTRTSCIIIYDGNLLQRNELQSEFGVNCEITSPQSMLKFCLLYLNFSENYYLNSLLNFLVTVMKKMNCIITCINPFRFVVSLNS